LYGNCSLAHADALPPSKVNDFFDGEIFKNRQKSQDSEAKIKIAMVERLNGVIMALGQVAKILVKIGKIR